MALRLQIVDGALSLSVEDDGRGFVPDSGRRGLGSVTMDDYLGAISGILKLDTSPGKGTHLTAVVPLDTEVGLDVRRAATKVAS